MRLTELGEGTQDTRRRAALNELVPDPARRAEVEAVLKTLADARLVTTEKDTAEVAHEALIREWPALREWLNENHERLRVHRQLRRDAEEWLHLNRDKGALYRGARLAQTLDWANDYADEMSLIEYEFLEESQEIHQKEIEAMEKQEEDRRVLAKDFHDEVISPIAALAMRVNFARRLLERDPAAAAEELLKIEELARKTTRGGRKMIFAFRPLVLESKGLRAALEAMTEKIQETFGQEVVIEVNDNIIAQLDMGKQGVIFNIVDEAVNNARKHAQATHIWVRLKPSERGLALLEIRDDGIGFDMDKMKSSYENRGSLGMINLKERAELLNGVLQLQSKPGAGTRVSVHIPLTEEATEIILHRS